MLELISGYGQKTVDDLPPFQGGAVGLLCYDFIHYLEKLPRTTRDDLQIPDAHFFFFDKVISFDHMLKRAWVVVCPGVAASGPDWQREYERCEQEIAEIFNAVQNNKRDKPHDAPVNIRIDHDVPEGQYVSMVKRAKEYIAAGDIFQANLSLRVSAEIGRLSPWSLYPVLRGINPAPFAAFMDFGEYSMVGSSPERLIRVSDNIVETRPIAGTRPRGKDVAEDSAMRAELLLSEKERAEHIMLIDLGRNDIGRVCDYGSVEVDELMITEDYSHVIHIVSNVRGILNKRKNVFDALRAVFPGGTITGVPKVRCMEIIDELETLRRGPYTGSLGYIGFSGSSDFNIVIRTFTIKDGKAYVQAGAGIVADSDPSGEYRESLKKAEALIKTLELVGR